LRIQLVYPNPNPRSKLHGRKVESAALQLLAALTPPEHEVNIVAEHLGDEMTYDDDADLIGITAMTIQARRAYEIADEYRRRGKRVVMGGIHVSVLPDEALTHADAVVIGEGELVWPTVIADVQAGRLAQRYRADALIDMGTLPMCRRDLSSKRSSFSIAPVQAGRGCPYDCSFCSATMFYGRTYRFRPVEQVIAEVKSLKTKFVFFLDDNIFSRPEYSRQLLLGLKEVDVKWIGQASLHLSARDPELLKLARDSGCVGLFVGIESLSEENLRASKSLAKNQSRTAAEIGASLGVLHDNGIVVMAGVIFGFDGDDPEVFDRTADFLADNHVGLASFSALTPFPGTALCAQLEAEGRITSRDWSMYDACTSVFTPRGMTAEQLQEGTRRAGVNFYSAAKILRRFPTNWHHPLLFLATSFSWRHACRVENDVPFYKPSFMF